jgi:hypothetical protein
MFVQPRAGTGADTVLDRVVTIRIGAPTLGEVDDADRRVTIRGDEHHPAHRLRPRRRIARQQPAVRVREAEVDEDRGALGEHAAVGQHQRRDLAERIDLHEFRKRVVGLP